MWSEGFTEVWTHSNGSYNLAELKSEPNKGVEGGELSQYNKGKCGTVSTWHLIWRMSAWTKSHILAMREQERKVMNSMYSHQGRSQGWANRVSEERSGWYAQKLVRQADTTVTEKELLLQERELTWYHSEWEGTVGSGRTSYTTYTSECYCST